MSGWKLRAQQLLAAGVSPAAIAERIGVGRWSIERVRRGMRDPAGASEDLPPGLGGRWSIGGGEGDCYPDPLVMSREE
jgi:hypothetical protein